MLTKKDTLRTIADAIKEEKKARLFAMNFPTDFLSLIPEEMYGDPIGDLMKKLKMPWGAPFLGEEMVRAANIAEDIVENQSWKFIPLWGKESEDWIPDIRKNDKSSVFLMTRKKRENARKPAVIICPGGGYEMLSFDGEGIRMAEKMEQNGYISFVLCYRVKPNYYPEPQKDLALAVKYVKANAEIYGADAGRIMLMGSSAGGHLCVSTVENRKEIDELLQADLETGQPELADMYKDIDILPEMMCLNYPVISFLEEVHEPSFQALTDGKEELRDTLSGERHVEKDFPKTFIWACEDDGLVPAGNAKRMAKALKEKGVPCKLCIYPQGDHGCGLATGTSAEGWFREMLALMNAQKE